ncbi:hypothetical protein [Actinokineospora sp. NBRC 105648]|uniref:hypothetical protein n=1 Tax=Actinokineospora sp. NBRC 105648 TaxID=3032206 RepID=UPI0024A0C9CD|nr:hypothetical protein [Actinokineospora sp. NBRC 105648]GLZ37960.1 hypothetical protein Acsp05_15840 [Actinokineospora sp. NBRC 105648]
MINIEFRPDHVTFSDTSDSTEYILEFSDEEQYPKGAILAIARPDDGGWDDVVLTVNPDIGDVPVALVLWAIDVARGRMA